MRVSSILGFIARRLLWVLFRTVCTPLELVRLALFVPAGIAYALSCGETLSVWIGLCVLTMIGCGGLPPPPWSGWAVWVTLLLVFAGQCPRLLRWIAAALVLPPFWRLSLPTRTLWRQEKTPVARVAAARHTDKRNDRKAMTARLSPELRAILAGDSPATLQTAPQTSQIPETVLKPVEGFLSSDGTTPAKHSEDAL